MSSSYFFIGIFLLISCMLINNSMGENQSNETTTMVPLCSCVKADRCADEAFKRMDSCKMECAHWLEQFSTAPGNANPYKLTDCFGKDIKMEGQALNECMRNHNPNFCNVEPAATLFVATPDYQSWMETVSANDSASEKETPISNSAFMRKSRTAFVAFRNFQKCMNNCAKKHSSRCFKDLGCAVSLPDEKKAQKIYNICTQQNNTPKGARDACRCLVISHRVYQLAGVCPLFSNAYLMKFLI